MKLKKIIFALILSITVLFTACSNKSVEENKNDTINDTVNYDINVDHLSGLSNGYKLEQVVILSRHNMRSPLGKEGSVMDDMTPHKWFDWTSDRTHLSIRGGVLETEMGQFFRKWFEREKLFDKNYDPKNKNIATDEVRIYANSMQRTLATANYFLTGVFPVSDLDIEHHMNFDEMDPTFNPVLTNIDDKFAEAATKQINEMFLSVIENLKPNYELIEDVIDVKDSKEYKEGRFSGFKTDDSTFILNDGEEPAVKGSLKLACQISDALTVQYYESDDKSAAFGKDIKYEDWEKISKVKDVYEDVLFTAPLVAYNVANPLLKEILSELNNDHRKLTYLCGHDSNIASVLAALSVKEYDLPYAIEKKTPIGGKIVISEWTKENDESGEKYISIDMMYQSVDELRGITMLDEKNPPAIYPLSFEGLERDNNGYFKKSDVIKQFTEAIDRYNEKDNIE